MKVDRKNAYQFSDSMMTSQNCNAEMSEEFRRRLDNFDAAEFEQQPSRQLYKVKPRSIILFPSNQNQLLYFSHIEGSSGVCITLGETKKFVFLDDYELVIPFGKRIDSL